MIFLEIIIILLLLVVITQRQLPLSTIREFKKEILKAMATQEERLQAVLAKIDTVLQMLADLKANNPDIEDEITAIEDKLNGAVPAPAPTPEP